MSNIKKALNKIAPDSVKDDESLEDPFEWDSASRSFKRKEPRNRRKETSAEDFVWDEKSKSYKKSVATNKAEEPKKKYEWDPHSKSFKLRK